MILHAGFQPLPCSMPGVRYLQPKIFRDDRGELVKPFREDQWADLGITFALRETFFSTSARGVLRGMHFQLPPHDQNKIVYCATGGVLDVLLDLRKSSPAFGRAEAFALSALNRRVLFLPRGVAHGFLAEEDASLMTYLTDTVHHPESDSGVRWDSFGFAWPSPQPIVSARDASHPVFDPAASLFP
jgi:dTDP-4-dehydrorhamnose 3,5-epimerase